MLRSPPVHLVSCLLSSNLHLQRFKPLLSESPAASKPVVEYAACTAHCCLTQLHTSSLLPNITCKPCSLCAPLRTRFFLPRHSGGCGCHCATTTAHCFVAQKRMRPLKDPSARYARVFFALYCATRCTCCGARKHASQHLAKAARRQGTKGLSRLLPAASAVLASSLRLACATHRLASSHWRTNVQSANTTH